MNQTGYSKTHERDLASVVAEIKGELRSFVSTRMELLKSELQGTKAALRTGLPMALMAFALLSVGYLLLTLAIVVLVAAAFRGNPYAWFFALLIVGIVWTVGGAILALLAYREVHGRMFPKKTAAVLKADKIWFENEVRSET